MLRFVTSYGSRDQIFVKLYICTYVYWTEVYFQKKNVKTVQTY